MKLAVVILAFMALCHAAPTIPSSLYKSLATKGTVDIMIILNEPVSPIVAAINSRRDFANSGAKTTELVSQLRAFTQESQSSIVSFLHTRVAKKQVKQFWITNRISVSNADEALINGVARNFDSKIAEIREAKVITLDDAKSVSAPGPQALEWGVDVIEADRAWDAGITGKGVVVAGIDTGVHYTHVALIDGMRTPYHWFDASSAQTMDPQDTAGHGTHTMGTIAGRNGTGVAPEAMWMHCRAFEGSSASEEALLVCGEWVICPTKADGTDMDCDMKPTVVSNSWGGGNEDPFYNDVINAWLGAHIVPVFAIGNSGPGCRTANSPGDQPNLISVGATNAQSLITSFSSHGPSQVELRIKPEVSAPGNNVRSASNICNNCYTLMSGTSMACPHTAGAVALLRQQNPDATFEEIREALETTAFRPDFEIVCTGGGVNATYPWPNNSHGYGNIRVDKALGV